ncbi:MFS transporter [Planctomycetes bacterium K23_9]|uniref:Sialic acid transporter n=1 Tax=Stieleria marina TaxID=1930275 RepID=A0A517NRX0_9BACT|nr:Putative sialic acid transporter [Planctomycetes bacterium K23_9]
MANIDSNPSESKLAWYEGISKYQWLVLLIASLGWVFDVFEGQIFVASMRDAMPDLLGVNPEDKSVSAWNNIAFGFFLLGGALGGVVFGVISDRIGRSKTMIYTILFYSMFTCISAFAQEAWQMVLLRFLVAMGVGGEWAVASAMVAEVMPARSRAVMGSIFHASSVFGTLLAAATIAMLIGNVELNAQIADAGYDPWRIGFAIGVLPAILTLWIRWKLREPDSWVRAQERAKADETQRPGRIGELFAAPQLRATLVGVTLATIGLVTFWGIHIYGKNALLRRAQADVLLQAGVIDPGPDAAQADKDAFQDDKRATLGTDENKARVKRAEMLSMVLNTIGGGLGLVLFGWISNMLGRKGAFIFYHLIAFGLVILLFQVLLPSDTSPMVLALVLPVFGFFTLGMHAGYAVYFPELFPTRLRGTGAGFCFNMGRLGTAVAFFVFGFLVQIAPETQALWLCPLYLLGAVVVLFGRETRGTELPE